MEDVFRCQRLIIRSLSFILVFFSSYLWIDFAHVLRHCFSIYIIMRTLFLSANELMEIRFISIGLNKLIAVSVNFTFIQSDLLALHIYSFLLWSKEILWSKLSIDIRIYIRPTISQFVILYFCYINNNNNNAIHQVWKCLMSCRLRW